MSGILNTRAVAAAAAVVAMLLAAAAPAETVRPAGGGGTLTIGISQFAPTLNPNIEAAAAKFYVLDMASRPFTTYDADWTLICMLCVTLPSLENGLAVRERTPDGKDGIAVTYTIRPGAAWGDGTPLTTADVVFTWQVGRHPQSAFDDHELYRSLYDITVHDARTFTLHFDKVTFDYAAINDFRVLPAHLEKPVFEADPAEYPRRTLYNTDPANPGLYFGPYRIVRVEPGAFIVLEPNPTWYGTPPSFDRIVVRTIENTAALEANLLSGDIDMIAGELGVTIDQALAFAQRHGDAYRIIFKPGLIYEHLDLNLGNPLLGDRRVRQALLYALDRQMLVDQLFQGRQPVALSFVAPLDWVFDPAVRSYPHDPERAKALLAEAGFGTMRGGVRYGADGRKLSLELMTTAGNRNRELVEQVLQAQWRAVGIDVTIRNEPARILFGETLSHRRFTGMAMFAWSSAPENVPRTTLYSDQIPGAANNWSGQNFTGYSNPEMDALIAATEVELDRDRRRELWRRMQEIYVEDLPALPLYYRADAYILPTWLDGVVPTGHQYGTSLWVETWRRMQ